MSSPSHACVLLTECFAKRFAAVCTHAILTSSVRLTTTAIRAVSNMGDTMTLNSFVEHLLNGPVEVALLEPTASKDSAAKKKKTQYYLVAYFC